MTKRFNRRSSHGHHGSSTANWRTLTWIARIHSCTLHQHSYNHLVRSAGSAITEFGIDFLNFDGTCFAYFSPGPPAYTVLPSRLIPLHFLQNLSANKDYKHVFNCDLKIINKQWEVIALEQLTSHLTLNAGPQQQRPESPAITPPGMR